MKMTLKKYECHFIQQGILRCYYPRSFMFLSHHYQKLQQLIWAQMGSKKKPHFGSKRVPSRNPYQSIDLIEYYKSYNRHKELRRGRQALESAKVNFFLLIFVQFLQKPFLQQHRGRHWGDVSSHLFSQGLKFILVKTIWLYLY